MIRWSYLLPRVLIVVLLVTLLSVSIPAIVRWSVIRGVQRLTGAEVGINQVWISPARGKIRADGVQLAKSPDARRNLLAFDSATLRLDRHAIAHRRLVVDRAEIRGLCFASDRQLQGDSTYRYEFPFGKLPELNVSTKELATRLFESFRGRLGQQVEEEFASVRLTQRLLQRWPGEFDRFASEVHACRISGQQLYDRLRTSNLALVRPQQVGALQSAWREAKELEGRIDELYDDLTTMMGQVEEDRSAIAVAFDRDRSALREKVNGFQFDGSLWDDYLLAGELQRWQQQVWPWLQLTSHLTRRPELSCDRGRGETIQLDEQQLNRDVLIRSAHVDGTIPLGDELLPFDGNVVNLSRWPAFREEPCAIRLTLGDARRTSLEAKLGMKDGIPRRWVRVRCHALPVKSQTWGDTRSVAILFSPGVADVEIVAEIVGDQIRGHIHVKQQEFGCEVITGPEFENGTLAGAEFLRCITAAVQHVRSFQVVVSVSGPVTMPQWRVESDLPGRLLPEVQMAIQTALRCHAERLDQHARHAITGWLTELDRQVRSRQVELTDKLGEGEKLISSVAVPLASRLQPVWESLRW